MSKRAPDGTTTSSAAESDLSLLLLEDTTTTMTDSRTTRRSRLRGIVGICLLLALAGMLYLGYFCPDHVCALSSREPKETTRLSEPLLSGETSSHFSHHGYFRFFDSAGGFIFRFFFFFVSKSRCAGDAFRCVIIIRVSSSSGTIVLHTLLRLMCVCVRF